MSVRAVVLVGAPPGGVEAVEASVGDLTPEMPGNRTGIAARNAGAATRLKASTINAQQARGQARDLIRRLDAIKRLDAASGEQNPILQGV